MKVLAEGKWKNPWSAEALCPESACGAKLLVDESDLKPVDYSSKNDFFAECAVCGSKVPFSGAVLPPRVSLLLNKKRKYSSAWD